MLFSFIICVFQALLRSSIITCIIYTHIKHFAFLHACKSLLTATATHTLPHSCTDDFITSQPITKCIQVWHGGVPADERWLQCDCYSIRAEVDYGNTESNPSDRLVLAFGLAASGAVNQNPCLKQSTGTAVWLCLIVPQTTASESYNKPTHEHDEECEEEKVDPQFVMSCSSQPFQTSHRCFQKVATFVKIFILKTHKAKDSEWEP